MKNLMITSAFAILLASMATAAKADNFLVSLLQSVRWQPPKCTAPEVLTQVKDRAGNIYFVCRKPQQAK